MTSRILDTYIIRYESTFQTTNKNIFGVQNNLHYITLCFQ